MENKIDWGLQACDINYRITEKKECLTAQVKFIKILGKFYSDERL